MTPAKLRETVRYELWYQARRPATWLFVLILTPIVYQTTAEEIANAVGGGTPANAPFVLAMITRLGSALALLPIAVVAGEAAARDVMTRMTPLLYTAPVGRATYLGGRLVAALVLAALASAAIPLGILLALLASGATPDVLGPLRPATHLAAWTFVALPNAVVVAAFAFAAATVARRSMAAWVASAAFPIASLLCALLLAGTLGHWTLAALLDPLGITTLEEMRRGWGPDAKRTGVPWLATSWLQNRALWLALAAGVVALTHRRFRFAHHAAAGGRTRAAPRRAPAAPRAAEAPTAARSRPRAFGPGTHVWQLAAVARESWRVVVRGGGGLVTLALFGLVVAAGPELMTLLGHPLVPTTAHVAATIGDPGMWPALIAMLLIAYYAGELVWRDREAGLGEIAGAAPVPGWAYLLGRAGGLALAVVTFQAVVMAAAMVVQLRMGYRALEPWLHLRLFLGMHLADLLLFVGLAVALHVVIAHKYVAHLAVLLAYAFALWGAGAVGVEHRLLVFARDPGWSYSDMRGFGGGVGPWLTLELYWAAWTALLLVGAALLWTRGREAGLAERVRAARRRLTPRAAGAASGAAALVLALGGFTLYNTNVRHVYRTSAERDARRAAYERRYGRYAHLPQPLPDGVRVRAELHPERGTAELRGSYRLVNRGRVAIDSVHVTTHPSVAAGAMTLGRPATLAVADDRLGYRVFVLRTPLGPGDTLRLDWVVRVGTRGFANVREDDLVPANGTYLRNSLLPAIGYQRDRELSDPGARRAHGLAPRARIPSLDDAAARYDVGRVGAERVAVEVMVATDPRQRAVAPGALRRTWTEGGRRWFHYATERPISNEWAIFSADYAARAGRWHDVDIEVLHHPGHAWNVDGMLAAARASLAHLSAALGPYPHGQLRLVERPGDGGAHADPIVVSYEEGFARIDASRQAKGLDFPFAVVAHEVAHQWWGMQLTPAGAEGATLLVESLAWYSAMGVVEHAHGREELERLVAFMREAWLPPRAPADPPLLRATSWFLGYRKGPLAMYTLREYVGAERVDAALRRLLAAHPAGVPPLPTARDLYREIEAVTPDSLRSLPHDLFAANTLWELATERVTAAPALGGTTALTLDVRARKIVVDTAGAEREVPMDDLVEIGAFADASDGARGVPVYRRLHRIRSGAQRVTIVVPAAARWAGVDPRQLLFDLRPGNNVARLPGAR
jgi:hypothetical protein